MASDATMDVGQRIACLVTCSSEESVRSVEEAVGGMIGLDEVVTRTSKTWPGGVEVRNVRSYRLGDYFESIEVEPCESERSFLLVFRVNPESDSNWKSLVVGLLRQIGERAPGTATSILVNPQST